MKGLQRNGITFVFKNKFLYYIPSFSGKILLSAISHLSYTYSVVMKKCKVTIMNSSILMQTRSTWLDEEDKFCVLCNQVLWYCNQKSILKCLVSVDGVQLPTRGVRCSGNRFYTHCSSSVDICDNKLNLLFCFSW